MTGTFVRIIFYEPHVFENYIQCRGNMVQYKNKDASGHRQNR